jgi:glycosyltransferase involved in cell wall biosynthesis
VVDGETGLLIPPDDPVALAKAVAEMLSRPEWASSLGKAGYDRLVVEFSVEKMLDATCAVYFQALNVQRSKMADRSKAIG